MTIFIVHIILEILGIRTMLIPSKAVITYRHSHILQ